MIVTFFSANFSKSDWKPCPSAVQPGVSASGSTADSAGKYLRFLALCCYMSLDFSGDASLRVKPDQGFLAGFLEALQ